MTSVRRLVGRFFAGRQGNVAVTFALALLPLAAFTGAAIDYGLATRLQVKLQAAADATALALCKTDLKTDTGTLQATAKQMVAEYMFNDIGVSVDPLTVTSDPRKILVNTHASVNALFSSIMGRSRLDTTASAQCGTPSPKTFEIALVLDNTNSMNNSAGGTSKLQALQTAASNFVDYIFNNSAFGPKTRISITPFAITVKLDPTAYASASWVDASGVSKYHWTNIDKKSAIDAGFKSRFSIFNGLQKLKSTWAWGGCFESLPYPQDTQDGAPTDNDSLYVPLLSPDEPGAKGNGSYTGSDGVKYNPDNSYLNDTNGTSGCTAQSDFLAAEKQACKYANPVNYSAGNSTGPNKPCATQPLQRLTGDVPTLKSLIANMDTTGNTNIHEGLIWGWRTLSPLSVFKDGASYSDTSTVKILIAMTDGANSWATQGTPNKTVYFPGGYLVNADSMTSVATTFPPSYASAKNSSQLRDALDQMSAETCSNAKAAGVSIYTIGFSVPSDPIDSKGSTLLQNCASSPKQFYIANSSDSLISIFDQIAKTLGSLRITQ